ncbi:MAG: sigma-70 family RNA polymerase sigma factor [Pirellulaceae bacterium]
MNSQRLQELYRDHAAALVLYARQWCRAPDDALQEAILALANCEPTPDDPVAWLYTATKRRAMNIARADARHVRHLAQAAEQRSEWFLAKNAASAASADESAESVATGLQALNEDERELVVARVWGGLSFEQLGCLLNCSASSAHRRYQAALAKLRVLLDVENAAPRPVLAWKENHEE